MTATIMRKALTRVGPIRFPAAVKKRDVAVQRQEVASPAAEPMIASALILMDDQAVDGSQEMSTA